MSRTPSCSLGQDSCVPMTPGPGRFWVVIIAIGASQADVTAHSTVPRGPCFPLMTPLYSLGHANCSCSMGQERGGTLFTNALEKLPGPALDSASALQVWLQVDKDWPGQLSRAVLLCCYGYKGEDNFL